LKYFDCIIATFFGAGFFPKAPGTFASIIAFLPIIFIPHSYKSIILLLGILLILLLSPPVIKRVEQKYGDDPSIVVIDEVLGTWIVFCSPIIPTTFLSAIIGLSLFRLFDISKPWIIQKINKKKGALYVLLDDLVAGLFAGIILNLFYFIYRIVFFVYFLEKYSIY
jgi:phosphatidylglycerophosphatase A